jgi:hypothetical protein
MNRFILEDTYESFIKNMHSVASRSGVHKGHVIRFNKQDGVNYKRLMDVSTLLADVTKLRENSMYESYYIFMEKHLESMNQVALVNVQNDTFFKRRLTDVVLSARIRSMYLEGPPVESAYYERFTSPHKLLLETDYLFDKDGVIKTNIVSHSDLQRSDKNILDILERDNSLSERFVKLANQYKEDYLMSKVAFSESLNVDNLDLKGKIMDQHEEFIRTLFDPGNQNIKYIYRQKFDVDAKIWIMDKLELLNNI